MQSAFLTMPGSIEIREIDLPEPGEGELLVKISAALTCGTDLKAFLRGHSLIPMPGPFGHEFSGVIVKKGKGVKKFKNGDAVMTVHSAPCLSCPFCRKTLYNLCENIMTSKVLGAFAEYIVIPAHVVRQNVYKKPAHLSFKEAAFLEPLACVVHSIQSLNIRRNDTVMIIGAGPIGLLHLMMLKTLGAKVIITGLEEDRLKLAKKLGADAVFSPHRSESVLSACTAGLGADYVFECTGQPDIWESAAGYVRKGGTVVLFGGCKTGTTVKYDTARLHYNEITLKGIFHFTPADVRKAYTFLKNKKIQVSRLISGQFQLKDISGAFQKLKNGEGIKYAIIP